MAVHLGEHVDLISTLDVVELFRVFEASVVEFGDHGLPHLRRTTRHIFRIAAFVDALFVIQTFEHLMQAICLELALELILAEIFEVRL